MTRGKLFYEKPDVDFWTADQLNAIEATMSGGDGGGGGSVNYYYAYVLCNSAASQGFGHVSIALSEGSNGALKLYSFYGIGSSSQSSSGSGFTPKVATIDPDYSPVTFDDLKNASGAIRQGIPEDYWVEEYSGYIILRIFSIVQYQRMLDHATDTVDYPPIYNLLNYNCYHYVYTVLGYGSIHLLNSANQPVWDIIPNDAFNNASHVSIGAEWIEKGYF